MTDNSDNTTLMNKTILLNTTKRIQSKLIKTDDFDPYDLFALLHYSYIISKSELKNSTQLMTGAMICNSTNQYLESGVEDIHVVPNQLLVRIQLLKNNVGNIIDNFKFIIKNLAKIDFHNNIVPIIVESYAGVLSYEIDNITLLINNKDICWIILDYIHCY